MNKTRLFLLLGVVLASAGIVLGFASTRAGDANAQAGPCGTANDAVDASEAELLGLVNQARAAAFGAPAMQLSGPINEAAQWHAQHLAEGQSNGHIDAYGRGWMQRMIDCGYTGALNGSGETLGIGATASAAFQSLWTPGNQHQSGVEASVPWNCAGVGRSGSIWVIVVALRPASAGPCPEPGTGTPPTPPTFTTSVPTNTPTRTPTPTPTATATPTADANYGVTINVCAGWNLLTMPMSGDVDDMFDTAVLDIDAIYLQNGETWLRWAPDVPAYARNLSQVSAGDVAWVYRAEPSCEDIDL